MQSTYNDNPDPRLLGQHSDTGYKDSRTFVNESEEIPFGRAVAKVLAKERGIKLPVSDSDSIVGISLRDDSSQQEDKYKIKSAVNCMRKGRVTVLCEQSVTPDDVVYIRFTGKSQVQTITFSAQFESGDTIDLKIDGVSMTQVPFNTSHDQTMADIAAQIIADFPQIASVDTGAPGSLVLTLTGAQHGVDFVISEIVIGGTTPPTAIIAETVASIPDTDAGKFRKDDDSSTAKAWGNMEFATDTDSNNLSWVSINLP